MFVGRITRQTQSLAGHVGEHEKRGGILKKLLLLFFLVHEEESGKESSVSLIRGLGYRQAMLCDLTLQVTCTRYIYDTFFVFSFVNARVVPACSKPELLSTQVAY